MRLPFEDRRHAGRILGALLLDRIALSNPLVLGLPRGGVPVAFEVGRALNAELDVFLVRKLGVPGHEELAMGAIASGGARVLNEHVIRELRIPEQAIEATAAAEALELDRRERQYRGDRPALDIAGRDVILVDDGLATGASMRAAAVAVRARGPHRLVIAVPVAARDTYTELQPLADDIVCAARPEPFFSVGSWYHNFEATSDAEVRSLLAEGRAPGALSPRTPPP